MPTSVWDQIQEKRRKVDELEQKRTKMRAKFLADDGEIDKEEEQQLAKIRDGISMAKKRIDLLVKEFERNRDIWRSHAADLKLTEKQMMDLGGWQDPIHPAIAKSIKLAHSNADSENYRDATLALKTAMTAAKAPHAEFVFQSAQKKIYEQQRPNFDIRLKKLRSTKFHTDPVAERFSAIDGVMGVIDKAVQGKKFDAAVKNLVEANAMADGQDGELRLLEQKEKEAKELLKTVADKMAATGGAAFKTLEKAKDAISGEMADAETRCGAFDFDTAIELIRKTAGKTDEYVRKVTEKIAEKAQWDAAQPAYETVKEQVKQLQDWGEKAAETVKKAADDALGKSEQEEWVIAAGGVGDCNLKLAPMVEKMQRQQAAMVTYQGVRTVFDVRMKLVRESKYQTDVVKAVLAQVETNLGAIKSHVDAKDFEAALALLNAAMGELAAAEADIAKSALDETDANALMQAIKNRLSSVGGAVYKTLETTAKTVTDKVQNAEKGIEKLEYEEAIALLRSIAQEVEDYASRAANLAVQKALWEGALPAYERVTQQIKEMKDWGVDAIGEADADIKQAKTDADAEQWDVAFPRLHAWDTIKLPPMALEFQRQREAQAMYPGLRSVLDVRLKLVRDSKYQTETVIAVLAQIDANMAAIKAQIDVKNFVEAVALVNAASDELTAAEAEIMRLTEAEQEAKKQFLELQKRIATLPQNTFREVSDALKEVGETVNEIRGQIVDFAFDQALSRVEAARSVVERIAARAEELAKERTQWEDKESDFAEIKKKVDQMSAAGSALAAGLAGSAAKIASSVAEQSWGVASSMVDGLKAKTNTAFATFEEEEEMMQAFLEEEEEMMQTFAAIEQKIDAVLEKLQNA